MTPKQKLIQEINRIIRDAYQCGFDAENVNAIDFFDGFAELEALLTTKAIGEWVPVAERLPEHGWKGIVYTEPDDYNPRPTYEFTTFTHMFRPELADAAFAGFGPPDITHWLDLDTPKEVGG